MSQKPNERIAALQEQLLQGKISRRDFMRYAMILGVSVGAAEALAACAPKPAPTATAVPPKPTAVPPTVVPPTAVPPTAVPEPTAAPAAPAAQQVSWTRTGSW